MNMPKNTLSHLMSSPLSLEGEGRGVGVVTRVMTRADGFNYHNIEYPHPTFPLNGEGFTKHIAHYNDEEEN